MSENVKRRCRKLVKNKTETIHILDNLIKQHNSQIEKLKVLKIQYYKDLEKHKNI